MNAFPTRHQLLRLARDLAVTAAAAAGIAAQSMTSVPGTQKLDEDYTARIKKATPDPRILDRAGRSHAGCRRQVPSPLKFLGYVPGEPGKLTYHKDIVRYLEALDKASTAREDVQDRQERRRPRHGRASPIADEATIKQLDKYKQITAQLTDPRKLTEAQAKQLIATGKPIYYATGSIHSPELGQPRDADGAGVPARGRGVAVHPDDPQQHRSSCSRRRPKWTAARRRSTTSVALQKPASRRRRWSTGASTSSTTTTATASASGLRAHAEHAEDASSTGIRRCSTTCTSR